MTEANGSSFGFVFMAAIAFARCAPAPGSAVAIASVTAEWRSNLNRRVRRSREPALNSDTPSKEECRSCGCPYSEKRYLSFIPSRADLGLPRNPANDIDQLSIGVAVGS